MPSEHRLWTDEQSCPGRLREAISQGGQDHSIGRLPLHPLDLALEDLYLKPEREHFGLKLDPLSVTRRHDVQQSAEERIDDRSQHAEGES